MYSQISANRFRTWALMTIFVVIVLALGVAYDLVAGRSAGVGGLSIAIVVSIGMTLLSYFGGDRIALWTAGAKPVTKREQPLLYRTIENLAIAAGIPVPAVYIIPDPAINAFATGRNPKHASVAVTTGALELLANEELEGVLAHECSHVQNEDVRIMTIVVVLVGTIALLADWLLRIHIFSGHRRSHREGGRLEVIALILGIVLALLAPLVAEIIKLAVSRRREYLADASGALLTRYPEGLARALEKIGAAAQPMHRANTAIAHLYLANPFGRQRRRFMALFSTHPPIGDRVAALRAMAV